MMCVCSQRVASIPLARKRRSVPERQTGERILRPECVRNVQSDVRIPLRNVAQINPLPAATGLCVGCLFNVAKRCQHSREMQRDPLPSVAPVDDQARFLAGPKTSRLFPPVGFELSVDPACRCADPPVAVVSAAQYGDIAGKRMAM